MSILAHTIRLTALAALVAVASGCSTHAAAPEAPRSALVAHPQPADGINAEVYSGDVHARYESQLGFRVNGKIKQRLVDVGAHVGAGQALAELDPMDLKLQAASAQATLTAARASRDLAQSEFNRYQSLLEKHFVSQTQVDTEANALKAAQAQVQQAEAALAVATNQAEYTVLRADHDGVITTIHAETGQVVSAGQPVATLARDGEIEVAIDVPENRIAGFAPGQPAVIESWADAGHRLVGKLREVSPEADRTTRTYRVRVTVEGDNPPKLGQTARVYFASAAPGEQQLVPLSALYEQSGKPAVWVVDPKTRQVHLAPVNVAAYREQGVLLGGGLEAQQWIVTAGVHKLRDGEAIAPVDALNRPVVL